jgi:hypothetical protein
LARLCYYSEPVASDGTTRALFGSEVAKATLQALLAKKKGDISYTDLWFSFTFAFLLNTQDRTMLTKMKNELMAKFSEKAGTTSPATGKTETPKKMIQ